MKAIKVYEHQNIRLNQIIDGFKLTEPYLKRLQDYHGKYCPYFSLINQGVRFREYVGVLKIGDLVIEVLPKTDGLSTENDKVTWQQFLIKMLRSSGIMDVEETGYASLKLNRNSILDLYMELFLNETRYLMHSGLIKKYHKTEGNSFALKGSIIFSKNIQNNLTHAERFYIRYTVYDKNNQLNSILQKAVKLISQIGNPMISATAKGILLDFPECNEINVSDATFNKLSFDRKSENYRKSIGMAKLLLLNYHPDVRSGNNDVLALMFDMNKLWEKYVLKSLRRQLHKERPGQYFIKQQVINHFWKPEGGYMRIVIPDIVVCKSDKPIVVLDTKWKNLKDNRPADDDLKQMLVYNLYNSTLKSALLYPANDFKNELNGTFQKGYGNCSLMFLPLLKTKGVLGTDLSGLISFIDRCSK